MKLVEIVRGAETDGNAVDPARAFTESVGETAIVVGDSPGSDFSGVTSGGSGSSLQQCRKRGFIRLTVAVHIDDIAAYIGVSPSSGAD